MANPLEASLRLRDEFTKVLSKIDNQLQKTTGAMENFKQKMSAQSKAFSTIASSAQSAMAKLNSAFQKGFSAVHNMVQSSVQRIVTLMGNFGNRIKSSFNLNPLISKVSDTFSKITSTIRSKVSEIGNSLKDIGSRIAKTLKLDKVFSGITKGLDTLKAKVGSTVSAIASSFGNIFKSKRVKALDDINSQLDKLSRKKANIEVNVANAENAQKRLGNVDKALNKLNSKKAKVETQIAGVEKANSQLSTVNRSITKLNAQKATVQAKLEGGDDVAGELADIESKLQKLSSKRAKLEVKADTSGMESAQKRLEDLNKRITKLNGTKARLEADASKLEGARKALSQVQQDINRLNREKIHLQLDPSGIRGALSKAGSMISSFSQSVSNKFSNIGRNIGSSFSQLKSTFGNFGNDMRNAFSSVSNGAGNARNSVLELASAFGLLKVAGAVVNLIGQNLDAAIGRFDTLQRFPKIMNMWGYSTEVVSKAQTKMVDGIEGLPTTLQDITANVQAMTSITGDLDKATDVSLALNNAFLASGASTADASRGLQQFSQMLSVGKVDMMAWRTLQETMPGALSQTAEAFGFAGSSATRDFYDALDNGDITMTQFQDKLIELSNETNGFADQAKVASAGIKTSFQNLANTMSKGLANSITAIDEWAKSKSFGTIAENIDSMKGIINDAFASINDNIPKFLDKLLPYLEIMKDAFNKVKEPVQEAVSAIRKSLDAISGDKFGSKGSLNSFQGFIDGLVEGIEKLANFASKHSDTIAKVIDMFGKLVGAFIGFNLGKAVIGMPFKILGTLFSPFASFLSTGWAVVKALGKLGGGIGGAIATLFGGGKSKNVLGKSVLPTTPTISAKDSGLNFLNSLSKTAGQFAKGAKNIALIYGVIKLIEELAEAMKQVNDKVPSDLSSLAPKLGNMAIALTGMGAFVGVAGMIAKNNFGNAVKGLAVIAGISANIMLASEAMKQIESKVPENMASFAPKLANMAIAISGMGVLVGVAGKFATANPTSAITGLALVAGISGQLMLAAEAMQQVNDKVSGDIGGFSAKVANIAIGIGAMTGLVAVTGLFASTNPIGAIAGLAVVALISGELMLAAEAMQQVNDKVTNNIGSFASKVANIAIGIGGMFGLVQVVGTLSALNPIGTIAGLATVALIAGELILVAEAMQQVNDKVPDDMSGITSKIDGVKEVIAKLADTSFSEVLGSIGGAINMSAAISALNSLVDMIAPLEALANATVPVEAVKTKISNIKDAIAELSIDSFGEWLSNLVGYENFSGAVSAVSALKNVANNLKGLSEIELDHASARAMVNQLKLTLQSLSVDSLGEAIDNLLGYDNFGPAVESVNALKQVATKLAELATVEIDHAASRAMVNQLKLTLRSLSREGFGEFITDLLGYDVFSSAVDSVNALKQVATKLAELSAVEIDHASARAMVNQLKLTLRSLSREGFGEFIADLLGYDDFSGAVDSVNALIKIANQLVTLSAVEIDLSAVRTRISEIKSTISSLNSFPAVSDNSESYSMASSAITKLTEIRNHLTTLGAVALDVGAVTNTINSIKTAIAQLNSLPTVAVANFGSINALITSVINLATQINRLSTSTQASATGVVSAFSRIGQSANTMRNQTTTALNGMVAAITSGMARAKTSATVGMAGFTSAISSGMARSASIARSGSAQIASAFSGLRGQLYSAGLFAMNGLSAGISAGAGNALSAARRVANSVSSTIRSALKIHSPSRVMMAIGEFVSQGLAKGITSASRLVDKASTKLAELATPQLDEITGPKVRMGEVLTSSLNAFTAPQMELAGVTRNITDVYAGQGDYDWEDAQRVSIDSSEIDAMDASLSRPVIIKNKQITPEINLTIEGKDAEDIDTDEIIRRIEEIIIDANDDDLG